MSKHQRNVSSLSHKHKKKTYLTAPTSNYLHAVTAASNKQRSAAKDTAKLDRETEELHRKIILFSSLLHGSMLFTNGLNIWCTYACVCACADERVTLDLGRTLQQARMAKSWTQKDLATVSTCLKHYSVETSASC